MSTSRPHSPPERQRLDALDRRGAGMAIRLLAGPLDLPSVDALADAVVRIAALGPLARVGLGLEPDGRHWRYWGGTAEAGGHAHRLVQRADVDPGGLADWLDAHPEPSLPLRFVVSGDHLAMQVDHRLGDGMLAATAAAGVLSAAREGGVPAAFTGPLTARPLREAIAATFGRDPDAWSRVWRDRVQSPPVGGGRPVPRTGGAGVWTTLAQTVSDQDLARLRKWTRGRAPFAVGLAVLAARALAAAGVEVGQTGTLVTDLRRYLPAGVATLQNFVTGVPVDFAAPAPDAGALAERLARQLAVG
ncbi:hypothetical protein, partial [Propionicimonas sp.]|uniref:hypothetical protein n=1 Tax=Propionicimonas sp. TaxID=1955623 RepID=UPI0039E2438A